MQTLHRTNQGSKGMINLEMLKLLKNQKPLWVFYFNSILRGWVVTMWALGFIFEKEYSDGRSDTEENEDGEIYEPKKQGEIFNPEKEGAIKEPKKDRQHRDLPHRKYHEDFFPDTELHYN